MTVLRAEHPLTIAWPKGPISLATFRTIEQAVRDAGYGDATARSEQAGPPASARAFAREVIYVIVNGGMSNRIAAPIVTAILTALRADKSANTVLATRQSRRHRCHRG